MKKFLMLLTAVLLAATSVFAAKTDSWKAYLYLPSDADGWQMRADYPVPYFTDISRTALMGMGHTSGTPIHVKIKYLPSATFEYDGNAHTLAASSVEITYVSGDLTAAEQATLLDALSVDVSGTSITNVGTANGTLSLTKGAAASAYLSDLHYGWYNNSDTWVGGEDYDAPVTLTVTPFAATVTVPITGNNVTATYDGSAHPVSGFTVGTITGGPVNGNIAASDIVLATGYEATATQTEAGQTNMGLTTAHFTCTNTNYPNITYSITDGFAKVTAAAMEITITGTSFDGKYDGQAHTAKWTASSTHAAFDATKVVNTTDAPVTATNVGDANNNTTITPIATNFSYTDGNYTPTFNVTNAQYKLIIAKRAVTITSAGDTKCYDDTPLTKNNPATDITITGDGFATGEGVDITFPATSTVTNPGYDVPNAFNYTLQTGTVAGNYTITPVYGTLHVNYPEITITAKTLNKYFDGEALQGEVDVTWVTCALPSGFTVETSTTPASITNPGSQTVTPHIVIKKGSEDVTSRFAITGTNTGTLTINKGKIVLSSGSATKQYDGTPLTSNEATMKYYEGATEATFPTTLTATLSTTGTVTHVSECHVENTPSVAVEITSTHTNLTPIADYFEIVNGTIGELYITPKPDAEVRSDNYTWTYDATTHTVDAGTEIHPFGFIFGEGVVVTGAATTFTHVAETGATYDAANHQGTKQNVVAYGPAGTTQLSDYDIAEHWGTLTLKAFENASITLTPSNPTATATYSGCDQTAAGYTLAKSGDTPNTLDVTADFTSLTTAMTATGRNASATAYTTAITAEQIANANNNKDYWIKPANVTFGQNTLTINPYNGLKVKVTGNNTTVTYNGATQPVNGFTAVTENDVAGGTGCNPAYNANSTTNFNLKAGKQAHAEGMLAGTYNMNLAATDFENLNTNYGTVTIEIVADGYITIDPITTAIKVTANSDHKTYDGTPLTNNTYTTDPADLTGILAAGDALQVTITGSVTNYSATATPNVVTDVKVMHGTTDVTSCYSGITKVNGTLAIDKYPITITSADGEWYYDGNAHKAETATPASVTLAGGTETFTFGNFASITNLSESPKDNTFDVTGVTSSLDNYTITRVYGKLKIKAGDIIVTTASAEKDYDGTALTANGSTDFTYVYKEGTEEKSLPTGYTVEVTMTSGSTITHVDDAPIAQITETGTPATAREGFVYNEVNSVKVFNASHVDVTANYGVTGPHTFGKLTIHAIPATVGSNDREKAYDGTELKGIIADDFTSTGFITGEGVVRDGATGTITNVAQGTNTYTTDHFGTVDNKFNYHFASPTHAADYIVTENWGKLKITPVAATVTVAGKSETYTYDGNAHTATGFISWTFSPVLPAPAVGLAISDFVFSGINEITQTNAGTYTTSYTADDFTCNNYNYYPVTYVLNPQVTLIINKINDCVVTVTGHNTTATYDGNPHPISGYDVTSNYPALYNTTTAPFDYTCSNAASITRTDAGTTNMNLVPADFTNNNANFENVTFNVTDGFVTINTAAVNVTITEHSAPASIKYDGAEHTINGYDFAADNALYLESYCTFSGNATIAGTDAGTYEMNVVSTDFTNTNTNFAPVAFTVVDGNMVITPRDITFTSASDTKVYDGSPLTNNTVTVGGDGFATGEGATYTFTGTQTEIGSSSNTFTYTLNANTKAINYNPNPITCTFGTLEVTGNPYLKVCSVDDSMIYRQGGLAALTNNGFFAVYDVDGTPQATDTIVPAGTNRFVMLPTGDKLIVPEAAITGSVAHVSENAANNNTIDMSLVQIMNGATDVTSSYVLTPAADHVAQGTLKMLKRDVTLTSGSAEKTYDHVALTNNHVEAETYNPVTNTGLWTGDAITFNVTGTITDAGSTDNEFTYTLANEGDYNVHVVKGTLTVNPITGVVVKVVGTEETHEYNAAEQTVTGLTWTFDYSAANGTVQEMAASDIVFDGTAHPAEAKGTIVGDYSSAFTDAQFTNNNGNYTVTYDLTQTKLHITPYTGAVTVAITGNTGSIPYDADPHTVSGYTVSITDALNTYAESDFTFSGTQTVTRTVKGHDVMGLAASQFTNNNSNYGSVTFNVTDGYIDIVAAGEVNVTSKNATKTYDGTALVKNEYDSTGLNTGDYVEVTFGTDATITHVGDQANTISNVVVKNSADVDVTDSYTAVNITNGTLTVTARPVTLTSATESWTYDDQDHQSTAITVTGDGFATGESFVYDNFATIHDAGTITNTFTYAAAAGTLLTDYNVTVVEGTLTIDQLPITFTSASANKMYDGTALTKDSTWVSNGALATGHTYTANVTGTITHRGCTQPTNNNTFTVTILKGTTDVTANYDVSYVYGTLGIDKRPVTITSADSTHYYDGLPVTNHNFVTSGIGFVNNEGVTCDYSGTITEAGSTPNLFTYAGTVSPATDLCDYDVTQVTGTLTVTPREVTVNILANSAEYTFDNTAKTLTGYTVTSIDDALDHEAATDYTAAMIAYDDASLTEIVQTNAGTYTWAPTFKNTNANYNVTFVVTNGTLTINPFAGAVDVAVAGNTASDVYDGTEHSIDGFTVTTITGAFADLTAADIALATGSTAHAARTYAGTTNMGLTAADFVCNNTNYSNVSFTVTDGYQTITPKGTIIITAADSNWTYDGLAHTQARYTYTDGILVAGDVLAATTTGSITHVCDGPVNNVVSDYNVVNTLGDTITSSYIINTVDGALTLNKRAITLTSDNGEWVYDDKDHQAPVVNITAGDLATTDAIADSNFATVHNYTPTAVNNTFTYAITGVAQACDYDVTVVEGTLMVNQRPVTVISNDASKVYDGLALTENGYTLDPAAATDTTGILTAKGHAETVTITGTVAHVCDVVANNNTISNVVIMKGSEDVTANYAITTTNGNLVIRPRHVTVASLGGVWTYDGLPHTNDTMQTHTCANIATDTTGWIAGEGYVFVTTGSQTVAGSSPNTFEITPANATQFCDYAIDTVQGSLVVMPITGVTVTINGTNDTVTYDGTTQYIAAPYYSTPVITGDPMVPGELLASDIVFVNAGFATAEGKNAGEYTMTMVDSNFANTNPNYSDINWVITPGVLVINPVTDTVTVTVNGAEVNAIYDGNEHYAAGYTTTISNALYKDTCYTFSGIDSVYGTDANTYQMGLTAADFTNIDNNFANVKFVVNDGKLDIAPYGTVYVTITENSDTVEYNGQYQNVQGYTATYSTPLYDETCYTFTGDAFAKGMNVGYYPMEIVADSFANTSTNFTTVIFTVVDGGLTINPLSTTVNVTITENSAVYTYDATEHYVTGYTVAIDNPLYFDTCFTFSGIDSVYGTHTGVYDMNVTAADFANIDNNFADVNFTVVDGTLTINAIATPVIVNINGHSAYASYDGYTHSVSGFDFEADNALYLRDYIAFTGDSMLQAYEAGTYYMGLASNEFSNTSIDFTDVTFVVTDGILFINSLDLAVTNTTDVNCFGGNDGTATIVANGVAPYTVENVPATTTVTVNGNNIVLSGLAAGDYTARIRDNAMNSGLVTFTINQHGPRQGEVWVTTDCNGSYTWVVNDHNYGTYYETVDAVATSYHDASLQTIEGCDSVIILHLTIPTSTSADVYATSCGSYNWNGVDYTATGIYTDTTVNAAGCDSIVNLNLTIVDNPTMTETVTACDSYFWPRNGVTYTASTNASVTVPNFGGCDSIINLALTINHSTDAVESVVACDSYTWNLNGMTYTASTTDTYTTTDGNGCNGTTTLILIVKNSSATYDTVSTCGSYTWNGANYTTSGNYTYTTTGSNGCDSVANLNLTVAAAAISDVYATACDSYTWAVNGQTYTNSISSLQYMVPNPATGCNDIVRLHLTINNSVNTTDVETACDSYTWINGRTYTASTNTPVYRMTTVNGCDSTITLNLTIKHSTNAIETVSACDSYTWHGTTYTASNNTATYTTIGSNGCDSVTTLNLTLGQAVNQDVFQTACDSYTWPLNGQTYTASTNATYTQTANNCNNVTTLHLTINHSSTPSTDVVTACDSYTWNGQTYTASTTATATFTNAQGCDSAMTLVLTVSNKSYQNVYASACDEYTWINGVTYTNTPAFGNEPTYAMTNAAGCDSVLTLHLTIKHSSLEIDNITACDSYVWPYNGQTYTANTNYSDTLSNGEGCDSIVTLNLIIKHSPVRTDVINACDSYTWMNGLTYTASTNAPTFAIEGPANTCDTIVTLNLTVNYSTVNEYAVAACDNFTATWQGVTYTFTASADTTVTVGTNAAGCDSILGLHLTVNYSAATDVTVTSGSAYTWHGNTYSTSGNYTYTTQTVAGCDSVITLHLTVTNGIDDIEAAELSLYPNPTTGKVTFTAEDVVKVEVLDLYGRKVATFENTNVIDLSNLSAGAYTLRVTLPEGTAVRKVVKR